eukprot:1102077-Pyramimonas_sp.AAC.1
MTSHEDLRSARLRTAFLRINVSGEELHIVRVGSLIYPTRDAHCHESSYNPGVSLDDQEPTWQAESPEACMEPPPARAGKDDTLA